MVLFELKQEATSSIETGAQPTTDEAIAATTICLSIAPLPLIPKTGFPLRC
jgi:hypothetical protein